MSTTVAHRAVEAIWRIESARIVAHLLRMVRDLGLAEQLAQDTFVAALEQWPLEGVPDNPGAWLLAAGKRRAIDLLRHQRMAQGRQSELAARPEPSEDPGVLAEAEVRDDLLRLIILCCHPVLPPEARAAMTLRLVCGLSTGEIGRAFLLPESTIAQRIVRGKRLLAEQCVALEMPGGAELQARLPSVLEVLYLLFNEGYLGSHGSELMRLDLCEEAIRLARVLAQLAPQDAEVQGLVALMELQASRAAARTAVDGAVVLLTEQDRSRWDQLLIRRGLQALERAQALSPRPGRYALEAGIAACHARAVTAAATDWLQIVLFYGRLLAVAPSPVVALNRAVAVAMAFGPAAGLRLLEPLIDEPALADYHLLPSVRGELLAQLGRFAEASAEFARAASLTGNAREQELLRARAAGCAQRH